MSNKMNALKTGAYARETLLPWESAEAYERLRRAISADLQTRGELEEETCSNITENRWLRMRLQRTTAISTHRHPFGEGLEQSGPKSWSEALEIVRKRHIDRHKTLEWIADSMSKIAQHAANWTQSEQIEKLAQKMAAQWETALNVLERIESELDEESDFYREYSPKQLDKRIKLENALDSQFDKLMARLINLQEARILRDKLRQPEKTASLAQSSKAPPPSAEGGEKLDLAELDRDDIEEVSEMAKERPSGDAKGPVNSAKLDRDDDDIDPFAEFVAEAPCAEPDQDDDGTDDWGQPKSSTA